MSELSTKYLAKIAFAVGYNPSDVDQASLLESLIDAGADDMVQAGVTMANVLSKPLALTTLIIFVSDNINMTPGQFQTSPMYNANVAKLRLLE